ncbi:endonuclease domain-containing protein [Streptomyces sp. NPDC005131]
MFGEQEGRCATCPGPAEVVDHCHQSGIVRGVLCYDCNHVEALHARQVEHGVHTGERCWFQSYWDHPPGASFGWYWPYENRSQPRTSLPSRQPGRRRNGPRAPVGGGAQ